MLNEQTSLKKELRDFILSNVENNRIEYFSEYIRACCSHNQILKTYFEKHNVIIDYDLYAGVIFGNNYRSIKFPSWSINFYWLSKFLAYKGVSKRRLHHMSYIDLKKYFKNMIIRTDTSDIIELKNELNKRLLISLDDYDRHITTLLSDVDNKHRNRQKIQKLFRLKRAKKSHFLNRIRDIKEFRTATNTIKYSHILQYRQDCLFKISNNMLRDIKGYPLLVKYGWFHPRNNPIGVVKDHRFSVYEGFINNIDPKILGHLANCELMLVRDNLRKSYQSSMTLEELKKETHRFNMLLTEL